jgi:amino acid adenylation domain-containing protein
MSNQTERGSVQQAAINKSQADWISLLDGAPIDAGLPSEPTGQAGVFATDVRTLLEPVEEAAKRWGVSIHDVIAAAWAIVIHRYTDQSDVVLGLGSEHPNGVARLQLTAATSAQEIAQAVSTANKSINENLGQSFDIAGLLDAIGATAPTDRHPVFQVGYRTSAHEISEPTTAWSEGYVPCDLLLQGHASATSFHLAITLRADKFSAAFGTRLGEHLLSVIHAITANANPMTVPLLGDAELSELKRWNSTGVTYPSVDVIGLFGQVALDSPNVCALEFHDESVTYRELDARSTALADELVRRGVGIDVPVAISVERSPALVVALLATLKAQGTYVPIDVNYPQDRRQYMLDDAKPVVTLTGPDANGNVIVTPTEHTAKVSTRPADERLGYLIYTSGSTGLPKGVALPERALRNLIHWQLNRPGFSAGKRTLQFTSLSFDVSFQEIMSTMCSGGTLVLVDDATRRNPLEFHRVTIDRKIERLFLPFVALRGLAHASTTAKEFPTSLTEIYTAGEQLVIDETMREFLSNLPNSTLENQYGPSESHVVSAYTVSKNSADWEPLPPIGSPIANTQLYVLDAARQHRPVGVSGELYIGGICLADGYLGQPERTEERFVNVDFGDGNGSHRLYRTGDLVHWRSDGNLVFQGRIDTQVKFRGFRIELGEIGAVLSSHPDVEQAVAVVRQGEGSVSRLIAFCTRKSSGTDVSLESLHAFAQQQLPAHMVPSHYQVVAAFPLTPSGKIDVASLDTPDFDRSILSNAFRAPVSATELQLAGIWDELLGISGVGATDDFFALGGDSLMAVEIFAKIRDTFGKDLPLGALAQNPTIEGLATIIDGGKIEWPILVPIKKTGTSTPIFCVHGGTGNVASFPNLARQLPADYPFYGLQWDGLDGSNGTEGIVQLATRYLAEIRTVQAHGPYLLAGQCVGGLIASEISRLLLEQGEQVDLLVMYDSPNMSGPSYQPEPLKEKAHNQAYLVKRRATQAVSALKSGGISPSSVKNAIRPPAVEVHHDVFHEAGLAMVRSVNTFQARPVPVKTIYLGSGERVASRLSLKGTWTDDFLGFSAFESPRFKTHLVGGGHNDLLYSAEAVRILTEALSERELKTADRNTPSIGA